MGKRAKTTVTYAVTIGVPEGSNAHDVQMYIRDAILGRAGTLDPVLDPLFDINKDPFTVTLTKRVTTYG